MLARLAGGVFECGCTGDEAPVPPLLTLPPPDDSSSFPVGLFSLCCSPLPTLPPSSPPPPKRFVRRPVFFPLFHSFFCCSKRRCSSLESPPSALYGQLVASEMRLWNKSAFSVPWRNTCGPCSTDLSMSTNACTYSATSRLRLSRSRALLWPNAGVAIRALAAPMARARVLLAMKFACAFVGRCVRPSVSTAQGITPAGSGSPEGSDVANSLGTLLLIVLTPLPQPPPLPPPVPCLPPLPLPKMPTTLSFSMALLSFRWPVCATAASLIIDPRRLAPPPWPVEVVVVAAALLLRPLFPDLAALPPPSRSAGLALAASASSFALASLRSFKAAAASERSWAAHMAPLACRGRLFSRERRAACTREGSNVARLYANSFTAGLGAAAG
mmetsp:Transcript_29523/g.60351  ORF Transcript_29523/g.60351 Transcript_29523/m.60351 type:complete len:385 (+) Transcript_29523:662-1816(+)